MLRAARSVGSALASTVTTRIYRLAAAAPADVLGNLEIRTAVAPISVANTIRQALTEVEPALPVFDVVPLDQRVNRGLTNDRLIANLTSAFALVALPLACLGLYGTISYNVARRVAELGLRMALGADRKNVLWLVIREAIALVAIGAVLGLPLAVAAGRSLVSMLHGVDPVDPLSYSQATVLLLLVAGLAANVPAYRASRIDPMVALRSEEPQVGRTNTPQQPSASKPGRAAVARVRGKRAWQRWSPSP